MYHNSKYTFHPHSMVSPSMEINMDSIDKLELNLVSVSVEHCLLRHVPQPNCTVVMGPMLLLSLFQLAFTGRNLGTLIFGLEYLDPLTHPTEVDSKPGAILMNQQFCRHQIAPIGIFNNGLFQFRWKFWRFLWLALLWYVSYGMIHTLCNIGYVI